MTLFPDQEPDDWYTPGWLFERMNALYGPFTLDVAASPTNAKCAEFFTRSDDGLEQPWRGRVWCNPPYKNLLSWVRKAFEETRSGRCDAVLLLLPAHTSTDWFHDYALPFAELHWVRRKVKFGGKGAQAYMPTVAVIFRASGVS